MEPPPPTAHVTVGCVVSRRPNWSKTVALNVTCAPTTTIAVAGDVFNDVGVAATLTVKVLVPLRPPASSALTVTV